MLKSLSLIIILIMLSLTTIISFSYSQTYTFNVQNWNIKCILVVYLYTKEDNIVNITFNNTTKTLIIMTPYNLTSNGTYNIPLIKTDNTYLLDINDNYLYYNFSYILSIMNQTKEIGIIKINIQYSNSSTYTFSSISKTLTESGDSKFNYIQSNLFVFIVIGIISIFTTIFIRVIKRNK